MYVFQVISKENRNKTKKEKQRKCLKKKEYIIETFYKKRDMKSNVLITEINCHLVKTPQVSQKIEFNYSAPTRCTPNRKTQRMLK